MPEVTGQVEKIEGKQAKNGDEYTTISLKGKRKRLYDWDGHCEAAGIATGDAIRIEHDGSEFPRVTGLEKVEFSESTGTNENEHQQCNGELETKMCALTCAALVLHGSNLSGEEITRLAEKLEKWITG